MEEAWGEDDSSPPHHITPDPVPTATVRRFSELGLYHSSSIPREKVTLHLPLIILSSSTPLEKEIGTWKPSDPP